MQKVLPSVLNQSFSGLRSLVVSIHDVSPATMVRARAILDDLAEAGVSQTSLLIVPDHHHRGLISSDLGFSEWLRAQRDLGHEPVLHGFYHLRGEVESDGVWKRMVTQSYTAGEGEFFDLREEEASERLRRGRQALEDCGVPAVGFIAPAWLLGAAAEDAVRREGFAYTTRIGTVNDLKTNRVSHSRSLVWSVRARWRRLCSLGWNPCVLRSEARNDLVRVGIHPPDWDHAAIRAQILRLIRKALVGREATTYERWLSRRRDYL